MLYHCHETRQHAAKVFCESLHSFLSFGLGRYDIIWRTTSSGRNTGSLSLEDVVLDDDVKLSTGDCACDDMDGDLLQAIKVSTIMLNNARLKRARSLDVEIVWCKWRAYKKMC